MKSLLQFTAIATLVVAFSFSLSASKINLVPEEEAYINDIPFSTEEIAANYLYEKALSETFEFEEEAYIDDIPFNTEYVAANCKYRRAMQVNFEIEEEAYVNDIPFNTQKVFVENMLRDALNEVFTFEDERYIDDIPEAILNKITQTLMLTLEEIVIASVK
ncbi:MAG: hypothetical protein KQH67_02535 [Bacteroidetes bacterium]|nr:hypothetical protein [Bacteroidota bacterium]